MKQAKKLKIKKPDTKLPAEEFKIKEKVTLTLPSYDIMEWEKAIILKCMEDNPNFSHVEVAKYLNVSARGLLHKAKRLGLKFEPINVRYERFLTEISQPKTRISV